MRHIPNKAGEVGDQKLEKESVRKLSHLIAKNEVKEW